jgi:hypothetical protein
LYCVLFAITRCTARALRHPTAFDSIRFVAVTNSTYRIQTRERSSHSLTRTFIAPLEPLAGCPAMSKLSPVTLWEEVERREVRQNSPEPWGKNNPFFFYLGLKDSIVVSLQLPKLCVRPSWCGRAPSWLSGSRQIGPAWRLVLSRLQHT